MIKNFVLGQTQLPQLSKALDVYSARQKAIATNIANVGTVGFQRKEVRFEEKLKEKMSLHLTGRQTDEKHLPLGRLRSNEVEPELVADNSPELHSGVNNVDIDREIVDQVVNEIQFSYAARLASGQFNSLRASIKGRYDR
jgi:flagellar basal-body rod protein FlgB